MLKSIETLFEVLMFRSRWLLAPMYLGMIASLIFLLIKFGQEFLHLALNVFSSSERDVVLGVLSLVDLTLVANLMVMVIFSGYENFVSKIDVSSHEDRPSWMGKVDYSGLKLKLIGSIVAISAIDLLRVFMNINSFSREQIGLMLTIHFVLILSGVLFAYMDKIASEIRNH